MFHHVARAAPGTLLFHEDDDDIGDLAIWSGDDVLVVRPGDSEPVAEADARPRP